MSRTNVNHVDFDEQDPSREADGDKKSKSKRPASENLHLYNLRLRIGTYGISIIVKTLRSDSNV